MTFDYNTLKKAAANGGKIGNWKGLPVFSVSRDMLRNRGNGAYYVVYDEDNSFVKKEGAMWFRYGYLDKEGSVHEQTKREYFPTPSRKEEPKVAKYDAVKAEFTYGSPQDFQHHETTVAPGPSTTTTADVRVEIDVEATLKKAREMTIEDLLAGFNYGLD